MAVNYYYNYAEIDPATNMCISVITTTSDDSSVDVYVPIPVYDEEYLCKYYNWDDGKFYYDAEYTQEYISPLL